MRGLRLKKQETVLQDPNPFQLPPVEVEPVEELAGDAVLGDRVSFTGPYPAPAGTARLCPVAGGVGVSTIIQASEGQLVQADTSWVGPVILVSSTAADRMTTARDWVRAGVTPAGQQIVGLVLVQDQPKISKATTTAAKQLIRMTDRGWVIPWMGYLREPEPYEGKHPLRFRKVVKDLVARTATTK